MAELTVDATDVFPRNLTVMVRVRRPIRFRLAMLLFHVAGRLLGSDVRLVAGDWTEDDATHVA